MNVALKLITPQDAEKILEKNVSNRNISHSHVKRLAAAMRNGDWKKNGDTICLNGDRLIDGQHRLHAIILANMAIECLVVSDLEGSVFDTKDIGRRRTGADTLSTLGEAQATMLAAGLTRVKCLLEYQETGKFLEGSRKADNHELRGLLKQHGDIRHSLQTGRNLRGFMPAPWGTALHYLFSKKDKDLANRFFHEIINGVTSTDNKALWLLREKLIKNGLNTKAKLGADQILATTIKAWNSIRTGEKLTLLKWALYEDFPKIK